MNIALGSTSNYKYEILKHKLYGNLATSEITRVFIADKSVDLVFNKDTSELATKHVKQVLDAQPDTDLAVVLEAGLELVGKMYMLVCVAAFWDGKTLSIGKSKGIPLPFVVSESVKQGSKYEQEITKFQKIALADEKDRIKELITMESSYNTAIENALPVLKSLYGNSLIAKALVSSSPYWISKVSLKLTSLLAFVYITYGSFVTLGSGVRSDFAFQLKNLQILLPAILLLWLIGVISSFKIPSLQANSVIWKSFQIVLTAAILQLVFGILFLWFYWQYDTNSVIDHLLKLWLDNWLIMGIVAVLICVAAVGYFCFKLWKNRVISLITAMSLIVGWALLLLNIWTLMYARLPVLLITPFAIFGLSLCFGTWSFSKAVESKFVK